MTTIPEPWKTDDELREHGAMIAHLPDGRPDGDGGPGWYVRQWHSKAALERALKGEFYPFAETGPFATEAEARQDAIDP